MENQNTQLQHNTYKYTYRDYQNDIREKNIEKIIKAISTIEPTNDSQKNLDCLFLGPKAENIDILLEMVIKALKSHHSARLEYLKGDSIHITNTMKESSSFQNSINDIKTKFENLLANLKKFCMPIYSPRYQGHQLAEGTIPSIAALIATIPYNQNNAVFELSPITTIFEITAIQDLIKMFGYPEFEELVHPGNTIDPNIKRSWGHLTGGGSVANIEALWSARNLKFFPLAFRISTNKHIESVKDEIIVTLANGKTKKIVDLNAWEILNIPIDEAVKLPVMVANLLNGENNTKKMTMKDIYGYFSKSTLQKLGLFKIYKELMKLDQGDQIETPVYFGSAAAHYCFPKGVSLLGLGDNTPIILDVDEDARISLCELEKKLKECLINKIPIITVIVVIGSTEESSIDPIEEILQLREKYRKQGLDFNIRADCAHGGYFMSMLVEPEIEGSIVEAKINGNDQIHGKLVANMNKYSIRQLNNLKFADSITVDPHKSGFVPYSCGSLLYRNGLQRIQNAYCGSYLAISNGPNIGTFGVEVSKSGAHAAAVYFSHQCIPLNKSAHGALLGLTVLNSKIFHCLLLSFQDRKKPEESESWKTWLPNGKVPFRVIPLPRTPAEKQNKYKEEIENERIELSKFIEDCRKEDQKILNLMYKYLWIMLLKENALLILMKQDQIKISYVMLLIFMILPMINGMIHYKQ